MSPKTESDELKKRVLDFLCDDIKKFFFIDCSSSKLSRKEIFGVIQGLQQDESADDSAKTLRNYQGSKNQAYYTWNREDLEDIISNSPNLVVLELPEEENIDKDQVKKILDLVERRLWKKVVLISKKKDIFDDLVYWYHKAGVLKLNKESVLQDLFPIHNIVVKDSSADTITDLVHKGADINVQDENKDTPLHLAVENGATHLVHLLLSLGADVNIGNIQNRTVLQVALEKSFIDIANILLTENIDVHLKDDNDVLLYIWQRGLEMLTL
ncbi:uncharacterized protein LOC115878948 [Sitophilus oryzae]|uniref:Uncharacterized protein LOC115878948 n=1 Tax=Sitophilus oryzae TaxID=7048 RepID=A0A6J2XL65_SITOR|nr:uncharacterized protein LOC115878948 [Sitophilus oryzae]